jgi:hypothetical protein
VRGPVCVNILEKIFYNRKYICFGAIGMTVSFPLSLFIYGFIIAFDFTYEQVAINK